MAFTYGFFNSLKGDRKYNAEQMSEIFDGILKDGIIPSIGQLFAVSSAGNGMQINVGTGRAWFDHTWSKNDSVMVLTVPVSDITRPRYDAVVLEVNHDRMVRANSIKIVSGESAVNPVKPTLVNTDFIHQYPLAYILVQAAAEEIKDSDIENMVGRSPTVFATGVLESVSIDHLWAQWKGEFNEWFEEIKLVLSDDVVTNLQYQIDQLNTRVPYKATRSEAIAGTNDTKYVTPYGAKALIDSEKATLKDQNGVLRGVAVQNVIVPERYNLRLNNRVIASYKTGGNLYSVNRETYKNYKFACYYNDSCILDIGNFIVGQWRYILNETNTEYGYDIIRKSDLHVMSSSSYSTQENAYSFIGKATTDTCYYVRNNYLYKASVTAYGFPNSVNITSVTSDDKFFLNKDYLAIIGASSGGYKSVKIVTNSSGSLKTYSVADTFNTIVGQVAFLNEYLINYHPNTNGTIEAARLNVKTGALSVSTLIIDSNVSGSAVECVVFSNEIANNIFMVCHWSGGGLYNPGGYVIILNENGILTKKKLEIGGTIGTEFIFSEEKSIFLNSWFKISYTSSTITITNISGFLSAKIPENIVPGYGYVYGDRHVKVLIDDSYSELIPITLKGITFMDTGSGYYGTENNGIYKYDNAYHLFISWALYEEGSSGTKIISGYATIPLDAYGYITRKR